MAAGNVRRIIRGSGRVVIGPTDLIPGCAVVSKRDPAAVPAYDLNIRTDAA